jgi:N-formylglutamate amidohydrolase
LLTEGFRAMSNTNSPLVLHIPHSSTVIPDAVRPTLLLTEAEIQQELLRMTDAHTEELFRCVGVASVRFPVSRIVVDPERFENDADEVMSKVGMGVVYTRTSDGKPYGIYQLRRTRRHCCRRTTTRITPR